MRVCVATEQRLFRRKGKFYVEAIGGQEFWQRYLDVFSKVNVVARVTDVESLPDSALRVDGGKIKVTPIPSYNSALTGAFKIPSIRSHLRQVANADAAFILRVPGVIGALLSRQLEKRDWPFALEVVGDPHESLSLAALNSYSGYIARPFLVAALKRQCKKAAAASYVTQETLQKRYPTNGYAISCSDVELTEKWFAVSNKLWTTASDNPAINPGPHRLIFVGSLSQRYKGLHILLKALHSCREIGISLHLDVLGDGQYRQEYEKQASDLGLSEMIMFHGYVKHGDEVLRHMQSADLFVMPSLVEGLPRAMIEAMACGLPCIGSNVGGIPELLEPEDTFAVNNPVELANKIAEIVQNPARMANMSARNRQQSAQFRADILWEKRRAFYQYVCDMTGGHMNRQEVNNP